MNFKKQRAALRHAVFTKTAARLRHGPLARFSRGRHFTLNERTIFLPQLPEAFEGLSIAHFSDPHVGELIRPDQLEDMVDATNSLETDLIAATGDFLDFSCRYLPQVTRSLQRLRAPLGVWCVLGNHDHLDNAPAVRSAFQDAGLRLLDNQGERLQHRGATLGIAGIDWASRDPWISQAVETAWSQTHPCELGILLAHHPHAFDSACRLGIDLTLSGHTHGGQVLVGAANSRRQPVGLAHLSCRYPRGLYARDNRRLFVSSGAGSWFPLRYRCPAEITRLILKREN